MSLTRQQSPSVAAKILAVLALLFVLGTQAQELAHYHSVGEPVSSSCAHCHSSAGAAVTASIPNIPIITAIIILLFFLRSQAKSTSFREAFRPRGPPRKS